MAKPSHTLRDEIIAIAESILETDGLASLQARIIAKRAGCSVGTVYNLFGNLDGLIFVANAKTLQQLGQLLRDTSAAHNTKPLEKHLLALALAYLTFAVAHKRRWKAVFEHVMSEGDSIPEWYRQTQIPLFALLASILPARISQDLRNVTAKMLFSATHGIVMLALDQKLTDAFDYSLTEKQLRLLVYGAARSMRGPEPEL
jgi:AcrR family transcriptional regulator